MSNASTMKAIIRVCGSIDPSLGSMVSNTEKKLGKIDTKAAITGAAVVAGLGIAVKELYEFGKAAVHNAGKFEKGMQNVATLLDGTEEQVSTRISQMSDEILDISNATGKVTADLTDGMYQVVSAFGDTADSSAILETAAKAASAGNATTTESIDLLSAVTKAYGDTSTEAVNKVSDLAFNTVKLGQTTFPELAASMGKVTAVSSTLSVSQEELFGVFATATGVVGNASEVSTQLKAVYTKLQKPTDSMTKAIKAMGYESGEAMLQQEGLQGTMDKITEYAKKNGTNLATLYGSSQAANLATALTGNLSGALTEKTQAMTEAAGATETAFGRQEQSIEAVENRIKNLGENFKTEVGLSMLPLLEQLGTEMFPIIEDALNTLDPILSDLMTGTLESLLPIVGENLPLVLDVIGQLVPVVLELFEAIAPIVTQLLSMLLPIILQIVQTLLPAFMPIILELVSIISELTNGPLAELFNAILIMISDAAGPFANIINVVAAMVTNNLQGAIQICIPIINNLLAIFTNIINFVTNVFAGNWSAAWNNIVNIFRNIWQGIGNIVKAPINYLITYINQFIAGINAIKIPDWVPGVGGKHLSIAKISYLAEGGFTDGPSIAGEVPGQTEAVISFLPAVRAANIALWAKAGQMLGALPKQNEKTAAAGELVGMDNFSLGEMASGNVVYYYDFSNMQYHPEVNVNGGVDEEGKRNIIEELDQNKYEFADWFENWIRIREGV